MLHVMLLTTHFLLDVMPGPTSAGISAVLDNTIDFVNVTLCSFLDRALECASLPAKFSIIFGELEF